MEILIWILYFLSLYPTIFLLLLLLENHHKYKRTKKLTRFPRVSIIIPAYNEEKNIADTITSLLNLDYPKNKLEIIVVNDGSTDNTTKIVKKFKKHGVKLLNQRNQGKAAALNNGLKVATGEFFACLDADSTVEKDTLKEMLAHFDKNTAAVTPLMKVKNPKTILQRLQWLEYILAIFLKKLVASIDSIFVTPGPFSIYRRSVVIELGGFDETNPTEDMELAYRLQAHNYRIKQSEGGNVYTIVPKTIRELFIQRRRWYIGSLLTLWKYRKIFLNRKYGDFGMFQIPINWLSIFLPFAIVLVFLYFLVVPAFDLFFKWSLTGFNILPYIKNINLQTVFIGLFIGTSYTHLFLIIFLFFVGCVMLWLSHKYTFEKMSRVNIVFMIPFLFFYYILLSFLQIISLPFLKSYLNRKRW